MQFLTQNQSNPCKVITWHDKENTGAIGWIVISNLNNKISGGGLFMDSSASLAETIDLAHTMRLKNALQRPAFGGGKGGIKFDPNHPEAKAVLQRFLHDNIDIISKEWCTGGDINTTTSDITDLLRKISHLESPFHCLADMLKTEMDYEINFDRFNHYLSCRDNTFFKIEEAITGFGVSKAIAHQINIKKRKPKIIVQGFGKIGKALCFYAHQFADIVGICEQNWFIYQPQGIPIEKLLDCGIDFESLHAFNPVMRGNAESNEDFLIRFLNQTKADLFCPCATRYAITENVLNSLIVHTFSDAEGYIISGANNVFSQMALIDIAFNNNIVVIPEWLSNVGAAILYMEALKYQASGNEWIDFIKNQVANRINEFLEKAHAVSKDNNMNIYLACIQLAENSINGEI